MADWQRALLVGDVWNEGTVSVISKAAADRMEAMPPFPNNPEVDEVKKELISSLRKLEKSDNSEADVIKFDQVWSAVYDWADTPLDSDLLRGKKVCWVDIWKGPNESSSVIPKRNS